MSKIGKKPIEIPSGVVITNDENNITAKGPKGELSSSFDHRINIEIKDGNVILTVKKETKKTSELWGLSRALIANMVEGVSRGYEKKLELQGVGYKVVQKGKDIELSLGFSHPIFFQAPEGIEFSIEKNIITVTGIDKQKVGQIAAEIRSKKKPEPYKGKGVRYVGEQVRRKVGKKVAGSDK
ncbi:50S ribosomal protein L6 [Patescibacteria group bacterium]|nr:50S ribosomal protein L6 [Patescibacteria group bacterium]